MFDHLLGREAYRARLESLVVATTGSATLEAIAGASGGFARTTGSFLDDGFADGMEVVGTGWNAVNDAAKIIGGPVTDTFLPIFGGGLTAQVPAAARTLTVGLPQERQWESTQTPVTARPATRPKIYEQWVPTAPESIEGPPPIGLLADTGFYIVTWYGLANKGDAAMMLQMMALREVFPPGLRIFVGSDQLRVTSKPAPGFGQLITLANGYVTSQLSVPWRAVSANVIAA